MRPRQNSLIGAVVLAAGKSTRMGEPKQLVPWNGRPLLEHTLANLRNIKLNEIVVVLGCGADAVRKRVDLHDIKVVENKNYEQGMGNSLGVGVSALAEATDGVLIVLADQPFVRSGTYEQLIDQYRQSDAQIVIPTYRGFRGNPVLLNRSVFNEVMALKGDVGCRAIFGDHCDGIVKVEVDDVGVLLDIDNHEDYERLRNFSHTGQDDSMLVQTATREAREMPKLRTAELETQNEQSNSGKNQLILVGWEPVSKALAKLGQFLGFTVTVVDPLVQNSNVVAGTRVLNVLDFSLL